MPGRIKMIEASAAFLIKSTLILALASAYFRWTSRSSAERHAVALIALLALPLTAVGSRLLPWSVALPESLPEILGRTSSATPAAATAAPLTWLVIVYVCVFAVLMTATVFEFWQSFRYTRCLPEYRGVRPAILGTRLRMRVDRCSSPWVFGIRRPTIVVPEDFAAWPAHRRRAALHHELAHIRRFDWLTNALARCICNVFWFQPLAWVARKQIESLAEQACDDHAIQRGANRYDYAQTLLDIARHRRQESFKLPVSRYPLTERIESILNRTAKREPMNAAKLTTTTLLVLMVICPVACVTLDSTDQPRENHTILPIEPIIPPVYPEEALRQHIEGEVVVEFDITREGTTENIRVVRDSPPNMFRLAAVQATSQFRYPPQQDQQRSVRHMITFELSDESVR